MTLFAGDGFKPLCEEASSASKLASILLQPENFSCAIT
jgi:hypothetical protein